MTPDEIRTEAIERIARSAYYNGTMLCEQEWEQLPEEIRDLRRREATPAVDALGDLLPAGGIRYAVAHPVAGISDPRFVGFELEETERFATEYDTHVIEQHLTEWTTHE